ncbi:glycosyltransferase family 4 protein [Trichoderma asperellum CBS 433.97]|uniref:Alpha-1,3/1,6-mannosyltransferase ALG2 n=1 Tax=Trichoderma asperellum (strain ATCC 204424 / CBS 433.97 / NBRC 101777) TaxID=1042311 RepID=A0A2T3Z5T8_TRIA4|nr:glycosyltransferase family 4 protein [Trichoderma asperellum CBS 433.97]PTB40173.1 glycosyltransferase family 4 protein [Trichoderma asperellum CBS 433.97]
MSLQADARPAAQDGTIVFFHPDLGIGGAERLVVDAAVGLQQRGHPVVIFTNHCDRNHCFDECRDGTLDVRVHGEWPIPMSVFNRLTIVCAILRHLQLLVQIALSGELQALKPRAFVVDQLSAGLPLLRFLSPDAPILFYCHFPDLLLAQGRQSALKRLYRLPFDWIEEWSMGFAQAVAVNSEFTKGVVARTWPRLKEKVDTKVVYPCVDTTVKEDNSSGSDEALLGGKHKVILSINRFERKKDIGLAVKAFAAIPEADRRGVRLILAGGYDPRVAENVEYHTELETLASSQSLKHHTVTSFDTTSLSSIPSDASVLFLLSIPNSIKTSLLRVARLLVYTPSNEHFGIVPLEAMLARVPVLAANTGGPVETIRDSKTGWLRDPDDIEAWSSVMRNVLEMPDQDIRRMGADGEERVRSLFGRDNMALRLETSINEVLSQKHAQPSLLMLVGIVISLLLAVLAIYVQFS